MDDTTFCGVSLDNGELNESLLSLSPKEVGAIIRGEFMKWKSGGFSPAMSFRKETRKMTTQYFQGDLMFLKYEDGEPHSEEQLRAMGFTSATSQNGVYILARGEKTGHVHVISAQDTRLFGDRLVVFTPTEVVHRAEPRRNLRTWLHRLFSGQDALHPTLRLEPGEYGIIRQRRYVRQSQPRTVVD